LTGRKRAPQTRWPRNLDELCGELGFAGAKIATAINGSFVAAVKRASTELSPTDEIEIVSPRQGG